MPKKGKKKQVTIDEDEQWAGDSDNNDTEEVMSLASLGKKKKKKGKKGKQQQQEPAAAMDKIDDDWDLPPDMEPSGKKKKKNKKKKKGQAFDDDQLDDAELARLEAEIAALEAAAAGGGGGKKNKKKNKKNKNKAQESFDEIPVDDNDDISNEPPASSGGKKNKKKNKKNKKNKAFDDEPQEQEDDWNDDVDSFDAPAQGGKKGKKGKKNKKGKKGNKNNNDNWDDEEEDQAPPSPPPQQKKGKKNKKAKNKQKQMEKKKKERQEALLEHYRETINDLDAKYDKFFGEDSEAYELFFGSFQELAGWYDENLDQVYDDDVFASKIEEMDEAWELVLGSIEEQWEEANQQTEEERRAKERADRIAELEASGMKVGRGGGSSISAKEKKKREDKMRLKKMKARLEQLDKEQKEKERKEEQERQEKELEEKRKAEAAQKAEQEKLAAEQRAKEEANWDTESDSDDWGNSRPKVANNGYGGDSFGPDETKKKNKNNNNNNNKNQGGKGKNQNQNRNKNNKNNKNKQQQQQQQPKKKKDDWDDSDSEPEIALYAKKRKRKSKNKNKNNKNNNNNNNNNNNKNANKNKQNQNKNKNKSNDNSKTGSPDSKEKDQKSAEPDEVKVPDEKKEDPNAPISMKVTQGKDSKKGKKKLRSPICVVMGHVDTGKTLILDKIRHSSVQHGEAGGITQQIGATYLTIDYIKKECARMNEQFGKTKFKVPGLLFIDTPGHESFTNLRQRGSSMCDIAILVVDITGGIENQTAESLKMLKEGGVPFIVALNKVDRCLDWTEEKNAPFQTTFKKQKKQTVRDFEHRLGQVKLDFANHGYNTELYYKNKNMEKDISLVPTSAVTGEGIPDLMYLLTRLTQKYMQNKLAKTKFKCNVLEVKTVQGYGATIDVILSGGTLEADDTIIVCGMNDAIVTKVKALLLPHEAQEMRVKGDYMRVEEVVASAGVRIAGHDSLDTAVAGSQLFILDRKYRDPRKFRRERNAEIERLCNKVQSTFNNLKNLISKTGRGVYVQASTLGALEALVTFLQSVKVPICGINIGNVHKSDVMKASIQKQYQKEYCLILAFNVRVVPDAQEMAEQMEVQIFQEEIIYQLHERFTEYITNIRESKKNQAKDVAVFPVEMQILSPEHVFNNKNPIVIGVEIIRGMLRINTPIVVKLYKSLSGNRVIGEPLFLGRITSIQQDHKDKPHAKQGDKVAVRIEGDDSVKNVQVGRSFGLDEKLVSRITRSSIDALKVHFKDELTNDDINHLGQLKKYFEVI